MDFSGFGHLFATQLSCDSRVAFFVARISEVLEEWRTEAAGNLARRRGDCIGLSSPGSRSTRSTQTKLYSSDLMSCCPAQFFCAGYFVERRESMQTNNKMAVAPIGKLIWQMSIPPLISMFLQYSYNLIDSAFVAQLSENALTAVSL